MSQSYYRKWRSQTFADIVGQEHVTRTLLNALSLGRLSHAYLFCGPRGVGKTSTARVLAKAVNCQNNGRGEPCNECSICLAITDNRCLDVIEIDAASNRRIEEIRDLREKVGFAPNEARYKFYILDEAHMLTPEASNALLKTLEEPPGHVIFILATTEAHQLPPTILSRCQRFDFRRLPLTVEIERLRFIAEREGLDIEPGALEVIARASTGSMRDAVSLLDQLVAYSGARVTQADVRAALGIGDNQMVRDLARFSLEGKLSEGLRLINQVVAEGNDLRQYCREVVEYLRHVMLLQIGVDQPGVIDVTVEELEEMRRLAQSAPVERTVRAVRLFQGAEGVLRNTAHPQLPLELALVEVVLDRAVAEAPAAAVERPQPATRERGPKSRPAMTSPARAETAPPEAAEPSPRVVPASEQEEQAPAVKASSPAPTGEAAPSRDNIDQEWKRVIEAMGSVNKRLQALLRVSTPLGVEGETVVLGFSYAFHQAAIEEERNRAVVEKVASEILGWKCQLRCSLNAPTEQEQTAATEDPLVKAAVAMGARIKKVDVQSQAPPPEGA